MTRYARYAKWRSRRDVSTIKIRNDDGNFAADTSASSGGVSRLMPTIGSLTLTWPDNSELLFSFCTYPILLKHAYIHTQNSSPFESDQYRFCHRTGYCPIDVVHSCWSLLPVGFAAKWAKIFCSSVSSICMLPNHTVWDTSCAAPFVCTWTWRWLV